MSVAIDYTGGAFAANKAQKVGTISGSDIDVSSGNYFAYTPTANTTFTFSNAPASGTATGFALAVTGASVGAGYDLANASYDSVSFSVAGQESDSSGLFFKPDGTKMYVIGVSGDDVNEYSLSSAWDVSTASYVQNFSIAAQDGIPTGLFFSSTGTDMYFVGLSGVDINQYSLSTAWDVSTASYVQAFSVSAQETGPSDVFFKPDGTKMYVIGYTGDDVNEYSLSTAWDISTASYVQVFSIAAQEVTPRSLSFSEDGMTLFIVGSTNDTVYQYNLSTAWDISTASYASISFSVSAQGGLPRGLRFGNGGAKMYVIMGFGSNVVYQYSTGTSAPATVSYPSSVDWAGGTAPDAPAVGETDVLVFYTDDGGTNWYGFQAGDAMA